MFDIKNMCDQLAKFYWSDKHPKYYVYEVDGLELGIGKYAHESYGAFNVISSICDLNTRDGRIAASNLFLFKRELFKTVVAGAALEDWLTLLKPNEFLHFYEKNKKQVPKKAQDLIEKALNAKLKLQKI